MSNITAYAISMNTGQPRQAIQNVADTEQGINPFGEIFSMFKNLTGNSDKTADAANATDPTCQLEASPSAGSTIQAAPHSETVYTASSFNYGATGATAVGVNVAGANPGMGNNLSDPSQLFIAQLLSVLEKLDEKLDQESYHTPNKVGEKLSELQAETPGLDDVNAAGIISI